MSSTIWSWARAQTSRNRAAIPTLCEIRDIRAYHPGDPLFKDATYVVHFAGIGDLVPAIERPLEYLSNNTQGTIHALECARASGNALKKFVYAASSTCYGLADIPTSEAHPIRLEHPYALSKNLGEQACLHWHKVYRLPVNSIRIFNAYGTRSRTSGAYGAVFGVFLRQKLAGKPFTVVGDGKQRRDFIYVTDVANAFFAACQTALAGQLWNLGAGNPQSINRLVELIGGPVVHIPKRPGEPDCTFADITAIKRDLKWGATRVVRGGCRTGAREHRILARCAAMGPFVHFSRHGCMVSLSRPVTAR